MEQKELPKLRNDETIIIKPAEKGGSCSNSLKRSLPKYDNKTSITFMRLKCVEEIRLLQ